MDNKDLNNNVDSKEQKNEEIKKDAPAVNEQQEQTSKEPENKPAPVIDIPESNETKEEVKAQNQTLDPAADFSSIFHVESEELPAEKKVEAPVANQNLAPEVKVDENIDLNEEKVAPKFNKDLFNQEEKVLYEIRPEKEGNPLVVVFLFVGLIAFIILLPFIVKVANYRFSQATNHPSSETEKDEIYELGSTSVRVTKDNLELYNFITSKENDEYYLNFTLTNKSSQPYMFDKKYYITLYDNQAIIGYALIHSYDVVAAYGASEVKVVISEGAYRKADHFKIEEIVPSRYPNETTTETEGEYKVLTCTHLHDEIKYYFDNSNNSLIKIKETFKETQANSKTYVNDKDTYRALSNKYKQIDNFQSTFVETNTDFTMLNEIELKDIPDKTLSDLKVYRYFKYSEDINTISFEIKAQGYTCR